MLRKTRIRTTILIEGSAIPPLPQGKGLHSVNQDEDFKNGDLITSERLEKIVGELYRLKSQLRKKKKKH